MSAMSVSNQFAVQLLQNALPLRQQEQQRTSPNIVATVNGVASTEQGATRKPPVSAQVFEALFDQSMPNIHKMKMEFYDKVGAEFGLNRKDFASLAAFGHKIKDDLIELQGTIKGRMRLMEIEEKLELSKYGLSLDTIANAMIDPTGGDNDRVEKALLEASENDKQDAREAVEKLSDDELGLYDRRAASLA